MKNILTVFVLLLLISGNALAGSEYDRCIKEEKALKTKEISDCNGLKYLLNPSACFATQKVLKEYGAEKCKKIGITENVDFSVQTVIPERKVIKVSNGNQKTVETETPQQESTLEQMKKENAHLKAEIIRLKADNDQLRKASQ